MEGCTHAHTRTPSMCVCARASVRASERASVRARVRTCAHAYAYVCIDRFICIHMQVYLNMYLQVQIHIHVYTYAGVHLILRYVYFAQHFMYTGSEFVARETFCPSSMSLICPSSMSPICPNSNISCIQGVSLWQGRPYPGDSLMC